MQEGNEIISVKWNVIAFEPGCGFLCATDRSWIEGHY